MSALGRLVIVEREVLLQPVYEFPPIHSIWEFEVWHRSIHRVGGALDGGLRWIPQRSGRVAARDL